MAIGNRPPIPKQPKIKNTQFVKFYRSQNPYCEICLLDGIRITQGVEFHHILPGQSRTDEKWNCIILCYVHHRERDEHTHGLEAKKKNLICWAIKLLKKEITEKKLIEIGVIEPVLVLADALRSKYEKIGRL